MKTIRSLLLILTILNIHNSYSTKTEKKQLSQIERLYKANEIIDRKQKKIILKEVLNNPKEKVLQFLQEKNFRFKEHKIENAFSQKIKNKELEKAKLLLQFQDIENTEQLKSKLFIAACKSLDYKLIKSLINFITANLRDENGQPPLGIFMDALEDNGSKETDEYLEVLELFFKNKVQIIFPEFSNSSLMVSVSAGLYETSRQLIVKGDRINKRDEDGYSALHHAVFKYRDFLKAESKKEENENDTPINENVYAKLIELLIRHKASILSQDKSGKTPLDYIKEVENLCPNKIINLLAKGITIDNKYTTEHF